MPEKTVDFKNLFNITRNGKQGSRLNTINVDKILNKELVIEKVEFRNRDDGKGQVVRLYTNLGEVETGSGVIMKQVAEFIEPALQNGNKINATIVKRRGKSGNAYFTFQTE